MAVTGPGHGAGAAPPTRRGLSPRARVRSYDAHAWVGVVASLLLHAMFFAGAFALFRSELEEWQDPRPLADPSRLATPARLVDRLVAEHGLAGGEAWVRFPSPRRSLVEAHVRAGGSAEWRELRLDPVTTATATARSEVADLLYQLHFLHHDRVPAGIYVAGVLGVAMLAALVTGTVVHLRDLRGQLVRFRPERPMRSVWSDLHKVLGVLGLPFQIVVAWSGTLLCLWPLLLRGVAWPVAGGDFESAERLLIGWHEHAQPSGSAVAMPDVEALVAAARAHEPAMDPEWMHVELPGDAAGTFAVLGASSEAPFGTADVRLGATDGALVHHGEPATETAGGAALRWTVGLHFARYGGAALRVAEALLAIGACATILSGNWIWIERRRARTAAPHASFLERLSVGAGLGIVAATGVLLVTNRLLLPLAGRFAVAEVSAFFATWAACTAFALGRADARRSARVVLTIAAATLVAVPWLGALSTPLHLVGALAAGRFDIAGVDLG
ncbi:MAG: PepSY domain-containing protein [Deltaproteobacteria bacterium]|nr:PepSY domain-containing protein [Deltaproteobacteria bacterium]